MNSLAESRALIADAAPGPWEWNGDRLVTPGYTRKGDGRPKRMPSRDRTVLAVEPDGMCSDPACCPQGEHLEVGPADRAFIAAARTEWPAALDEIERLRDVLARLDAAKVITHHPFDHDYERDAKACQKCDAVRALAALRDEGVLSLAEPQCDGYTGDLGASAYRCESYRGHPGRCFLRR